MRSKIDLKLSENDIPWSCPNCGMKHANIDKQTRSKVTIKIRDKYYWVTTYSGITTVETVCKKCGTFSQIKCEQ